MFTFSIALILIKLQSEWGEMVVVFHFFLFTILIPPSLVLALGGKIREKRLETKLNAFHLYIVDLIFSWLVGLSRKQGPKCWLFKGVLLCIFQKLHRALVGDVCSAMTGWPFTAVLSEMHPIASCWRTLNLGR